MAVPRRKSQKRPHSTPLLISRQRWTAIKNSLVEKFMSKKVLKFEFEKETKNSVRYKEVPDEGTAPIVGSLYIQKWFAGSSKTIEITIDKKD
jgi:hypothetical protein